MSTATCEFEELFQHSAWQRSPSEELLNALTHSFGTMLAVVGGFIMGGSLWQYGDAWRVAGCAIFVASQVAVFAASVLSHSSSNVRRKAFFRRLDQGFIYFLIVATYTPFGLVYFRTSTGWLLLGALWAAAIIGFVSKVVIGHRVHAISLWTYLALSFLPWIAVPVLRHAVSVECAGLMVAGGVFFLLGTLFLLYDARVRHFHAVWHLLVIAGSVCHFLGIWEAVALAAN